MGGRQGNAHSVTRKWGEQPLYETTLDLEVKGQRRPAHSSRAAVGPAGQTAVRALHSLAAAVLAAPRGAAPCSGASCIAAVGFRVRSNQQASQTGTEAPKRQLGERMQTLETLPCMAAWMALGCSQAAHCTGRQRCAVELFLGSSIQPAAAHDQADCAV